MLLTSYKSDLANSKSRFQCRISSIHPYAPSPKSHFFRPLSSQRNFLLWLSRSFNIITLQVTFSSSQNSPLIKILPVLPFLKPSFLKHPHTRQIFGIRCCQQYIILLICCPKVSIPLFPKSRYETYFPWPKTSRGTSATPHSYIPFPKSPDGVYTLVPALEQCPFLQSCVICLDFPLPRLAGGVRWPIARSKVSLQWAAKLGAGHESLRCLLMLCAS